MISPNVKGGPLALAMTAKGYAFGGGNVSPLAYKTMALRVRCWFAGRSATQKKNYKEHP
jgi:hypothetical protein